MRKNYIKGSVDFRLWSRINIDAGLTACWPFEGAPCKDGYRQMKISTKPDKKRGAHILAWESFNQASVLPGFKMLHSCHNPVCCNPSHLRVGTDQENSDDRVAAGRQAKGEIIAARRRGVPTRGAAYLARKSVA
jgi:hypothetical protein